MKALELVLGSSEGLLAGKGAGGAGHTAWACHQGSSAALPGPRCLRGPGLFHLYRVRAGRCCGPGRRLAGGAGAAQRGAGGAARPAVRCVTSWWPGRSAGGGWRA